MLNMAIPDNRNLGRGVLGDRVGVGVEGITIMLAAMDFLFSYCLDTIAVGCIV